MITLNNIVKQYNNNVVLNNISLNIKRGQSIAFTGRNGCGKSTLLKIIAGLIRPTSGKVGYEKSVLFHYVPEHFPKMNLTAKEYLVSQGKMSGLDEAETKQRIQCLSEEFFLSQMLNTPIKHLSKGTLQKVSVIQALLKKPDVLMLDEPLAGQDVLSQQVFIQKINELLRKSVTILMSCHEPYLVDAISDCVYRFDNGKLARVKNEAPKKEKCYILFFEKHQNVKIPEKYKGHLQFIENGCNLRVEEPDCNTAIFEMMGAGWDLRGMINENNK